MDEHPIANETIKLVTIEAVSKAREELSEAVMCGTYTLATNMQLADAAKKAVSLLDALERAYTKGDEHMHRGRYTGEGEYEIEIPADLLKDRDQVVVTCGEQVVAFHMKDHQGTIIKMKAKVKAPAPTFVSPWMRETAPPVRQHWPP